MTSNICGRLLDIQKAVLEGQFMQISDNVCAPKAAVFAGAKLNVLSFKINAFDEITEKINTFKVRHQPSLLKSDAHLVEAAQTLEYLVTDLCSIHERLHRLGLVRRSIITDRGTHESSRENSEHSVVPEHKRGFTGLAGMWAGIGRSAFALGQRAAEAATGDLSKLYERAKSSLPERFTEDTAGHYVRSVVSICSAVQVFDLWQKHFDHLVRAPSSTQIAGALARLKTELDIVYQILEAVLVEILSRDLEYLIEQYLSKVMQHSLMP